MASEFLEIKIEAQESFSESSVRENDYIIIKTEEMQGRDKEPENFNDKCQIKKEIITVKGEPSDYCNDNYLILGKTEQPFLFEDTIKEETYDPMQQKSYDTGQAEPQQLKPYESVDDSTFIVPDVIISSESTHYINGVSEAIFDINSTMDGKFVCPICHRRFANKSNVRRHIVLHSQEKFKCNVCFKQFRRKGHYQQHLRTHTDEKPYVCDMCSKGFRTKSNLNQHRNTHAKDKLYECEKCGRQYSVQMSLIKHLNMGKCKKKDKIICPVCEKVFTKQYLYRSHLRRHDDERPFSCEICKMSFKYKSTLIRHIQLHNGNKPFSCKVCRKSFTHAGLIKPHMRKHTGEKPYQCSVCKKMFGHKHNMERHKLRHAKIKHLVCDVCHKTFPKESRLKYHMRIHTNTKPFKCSLCGKTFSHRQNILRHYNRKHPNDTYECTDTDASVAKDIWNNVVKKKIALGIDIETVTEKN